MVRAFRQSGIGQLFLGGIVVAIILAFVLSGNTPGGSIEEECAVEVGDTCVEPKEFLAAYGLLTSIGINEQAAKQLNLKQQVARGLAEREVLVAEAKRLGISTSEQAIDDELFQGRSRVSLPAEDAERLALSLAMCVDGPMGCEPGTIGLRSLRVKRDGQFDYDLYQRQIRNMTGRSPSLFKEMQQREYTAERLRQLIRSQVRVSEEEAFLAYSRARSKATARVVQLRDTWFLRYVAGVDEDDVQAWKEKHADELKTAAQQQAQGWPAGCPVVSWIQLDSEGADDDSEQRLARIRQRILVSKDWDLAARQHSKGAFAQYGGRIGCLSAAQIPGKGDIESAVEELEPGEISTVLQTLRGPAIVRLEGRVEEGSTALAEDYLAYKMTAEARADDEAKAFAKALIADLNGGADIAEATEAAVVQLLEGVPSALAEQAAESDDRPLSDISRSFTIEQQPVANAAPGKNLAAALFDLEPDQVLPEPAETQEGFVVLQLKDKDVLSRDAFAKDKDRVVAQLRARKAEQALGRYVEELLSDAGNVRYSQSYVPSGDEDEDETES